MRVSWEEVWEDVRRAVRFAGTRAEAVEEASHHLQRDVSWEALARAWRRQVAGGQENGQAHRALGEALEGVSEPPTPEPMVPSIEWGRPSIYDTIDKSLPTPEGTKHGIIGDLQLQPGVPLWHLPLIARYFAEKEVDVVVDLGDAADMKSLSKYDTKAKKAREKVNTKADFSIANRGRDMIEEEWARLGYQPKRKIITLGNHENRINAYVDEHPEARGDVCFSRFNLFDHGWEVYPFLQPVTVDGVTYCHFFPRAASGKVTQSKRGAPTALAQVRREMRSCTAGHAQGLSTGSYYNGERRFRGVILGSSYPHEEEYQGPQGNKYWRGILLKHNVKDGDYNICEVPLSYLEKKYGRS